MGRKKEAAEAAAAALKEEAAAAAAITISRSSETEISATRLSGAVITTFAFSDKPTLDIVRSEVERASETEGVRLVFIDGSILETLEQWQAFLDPPPAEEAA